MKKPICLLLALVLLTGVLSGCLPSSDPNLNAQPSSTEPSASEVAPSQTQTTALPTQTTVPAEPDPLVYTWINVPGFDWNVNAPDTIIGHVNIINSVEDLAVLGDHLTFESYQGETLEDYLAAYDDTFYAENTLILVGNSDTYAPAYHKLVDFVRNPDGTYFITVDDAQRPGFGNDGDHSISWIIIEVTGKIPNDAVIGYENLDKN